MLAAMTLAIVNIGELVTLAGPEHYRTGAWMQDVGLVHNATVQIKGSRIIYAGPAADAPEMPGEVDEVDAGGRVVTPGFIDAHTHLVFGGNRIDEFERRIRGESYEEIAARGGGIRSTMTATREATDMELLTLAQRRLALAMRCGTTALEIKSGYGLNERAEKKMLRVIAWLRDASKQRIAATYLGAHTVPPEFDGKADAYIDLLCQDTLPKIARGKLADYADVFCERGAFSPAQATRYLLAAKAHGLRLRAHVDQLSRSGGAELAAACGCFTADHLEYTEESGIESLLRANVQPVLLPASVHALGKTRYPNARAMIEAGLGVVLATDFNPGSSPTLSLPFVMSLACTHLKMTPAEAITAVTYNAACCLGWHNELGSIEEDKRADLVVHDCADYRELCYYIGSETARVVVVGGRIAYNRDGGAE